MYVMWFICEEYICYPSQKNDSTDTTALAIPLCRRPRDLYSDLNILYNLNRNLNRNKRYS